MAITFGRRSSCLVVGCFLLAGFARPGMAQGIKVRELCTLKDDFALGTPAMAMSRDGKTLASSSLVKGVRLWSVDKAKEIRTIPYQGGARALAFSYDGKRLAIAGDTGTVLVVNVATGATLAKAVGPVGRIDCVVFSPSGKSLLVTHGIAEDVAIRLVDAGTGKEVRKYKGHTLGVTALAFAADGKSFVSGGYDNAVRVWEVAKPKEVRNFEIFGGLVQAVALSPDGKRIVAGSADKTLRHLAADSGEELRKLDESAGSVNGVVLLPGGRYVVSGSGGSFQAVHLPGRGVQLKMNLGKENALRLWDLDTGKQTHVFEGPAYAITSVAASADGRRLFAGCANGTMHVWELPDVKDLP